VVNPSLNVGFLISDANLDFVLAKHGWASHDVWMIDWQKELVYSVWRRLPARRARHRKGRCFRAVVAMGFSWATRLLAHVDGTLRGLYISAHSPRIVVA
jgi:hypothetical protein